MWWSTRNYGGEYKGIKKSCNNCVNNEHGTCEEYGFFYNGIAPVNVQPPYNEPCDLWTNDPKEKNTWRKYV